MATPKILQWPNLAPILLGLGVIGVVYVTREKQAERKPDPFPLPPPLPIPGAPLPEGSIPSGTPLPLPPANIPPGRVPVPTIPTSPNTSAFVRNPLFYAPGAQPAVRPNPLGVITYPERDQTGNCRGSEVWIPITDPRIHLFPEIPRINTRNGLGICIPIERLGGQND